MDSDHDSLVNATAVAIDKDKNSQTAVRWAIDHLLVNNPLIVLIHVTHKNHQHHASNSNDGQVDEIKQLFIPFRAFCARKGVKLKEVVLEEADVARAILEYINKNLIGSITIGASTKKGITRKLIKNQDVPSNLMKSAPEFCSVYVISKGKIISAKTAHRPVLNSAAPPRTQSLQIIPSQVMHDSQSPEPADSEVRGQRRIGTWRNSVSGEISSENISDSRWKSATRLSVDSIGSLLPDTITSTSLLDGSESAAGSMDVKAQSSDAMNVEAEMRRLKLELKQTMNMYSTACKEALTAKKKANELHQWKMEEARKFQEARNAEEAALALVEMEKAKCKAALEAAQKARKIAEIEAQRRKHAEMKAKQEADEKNRALNALAGNDVRYRKYTIEEIKEATDEFSPSLKIGEGGYGPVYRGKLDHTPVAIKVLRPDAAQGQKQFQQEVEILCSMRHPNMVLLLGACPEYGCLVYEYMENGSLEDRLLQRDNTPPLSWRKRFKIAAEIATALLFLHQAKPEPLVHRDLKPANILLDRNYVSKISDVGLARLVPTSVADSVTQYYLTSAAGTFCYIDPEYQQTGMLTTRSDIYSMGIMLLQIITAKPPMGIAHQVLKAIERGKIEDVLDQSVPDWPIEETLHFAKLAMKCCELRMRDRPSLSSVIVPELNRLTQLGRKPELPRAPMPNSHARVSSTNQELASRDMDEGTEHREHGS